jgi:hypothetical protein
MAFSGITPMKFTFKPLYNPLKPSRAIILRAQSTGPEYLALMSHICNEGGARHVQTLLLTELLDEPGFHHVDRENAAQSA